MLTQGCLTVPSHLNEQVFFSHQPLNMLAIDLPAAPTQFCRDTSGAIARKLQRNGFHRFAQLQFLSACEA